MSFAEKESPVTNPNPHHVVDLVATAVATGGVAGWWSGVLQPALAAIVLMAMAVYWTFRAAQIVRQYFRDG